MIDSAGVPVAKQMHDAVLEPLGMDHSTYEQPLARALEPDASSAHSPNGEPIKGRWHIYPEQAAAGLWTTPTDLAKYLVALRAAYRGDAHAILSQEMARKMMTPGLGGFGLGIAVGGRDAMLYVTHNGSNEGFRCGMIEYLQTGQGAVVMANSDNGDALIQQIIHQLGQINEWPGVGRRVQK
jgi:CubicO group peptidase (beta-lactamase class C family)